ncbi:MAG: hypothetical protein M0Z34_11195 [Nitrospiraceae bacterium]|nr:hypothetical protein [Nitrospiraceae bacterium]
MGGRDCEHGSVIAAVKAQGQSFTGIVNYLLGPGRSEEHVDQRVVAASADVEVAVGRALDDEERLSLGAQLSLYPAMFPGACPTKGEVYHVVFSLPEGEQLSDEQWAEVAGEMAKVLHLERPSGSTASWAGFRHGPSAAGFDHMHFVCGLVRSDGTEVKTYLRNGFAELHAVARRAEQRFGLRPLVEHGEGSVPVAQRPEREACARRGRAEPERLTLARAVRSAGEAARHEGEFLDQLRGAGVLVRPRYGSGSRSEVVGYSVALKPSDGQMPVWFGGGRLGRDLTLPALREQWQPVDEAGQGAVLRRWQGHRSAVGLTAESALAAAARRQSGDWGRAADRLEATAGRLSQAATMTPAEWRQVAREAAGVTAGLAGRLERERPGALSAAADTLARCAQQPVARRVPSSAGRSMRGVASVCAQHQMAGASEGWLRVVRELARLAETLAEVADSRQELAYQATRARLAAADLAAAHTLLAANPPPHLTRRPATNQVSAAGRLRSPEPPIPTRTPDQAPTMRRPDLGPNRRPEPDLGR